MPTDTSNASHESDIGRGAPIGTEKGRLARLGELDQYQVAEGEPDVRGWKVKTPDGRDAGVVESLIVDLGALRVRYLEVGLDREALRLGRSRNILVPIEAAWLDDDRGVVHLTLTAMDLIAAPAYDPRSFSALDDEALKRRYTERLAQSEPELHTQGRRRLTAIVELRARVVTPAAGEAAMAARRRGRNGRSASGSS